LIRIEIEGTRIVILQGDLTVQEVDVLVNAANERLRGGGGVDGAIHRIGGQAVTDECDFIREQQGGCPTGQAVITTVGELPAKHVIHAVGPVWTGGDRDEDQLLASAYEESLKLARSHGLKSVAIAAISTGDYGFPRVRAARIALDTAVSFARAGGLDEIRLVLFTNILYDDYSRLALSEYGGIENQSAG